MLRLMALLLGALISEQSIALGFASDNSAFLSQSSLPSSLQTGQKQSVSITFKNTGTTSWIREAGYALKLTSSTCNVGIKSIALPKTIGVGGTVAFKSTITAPGSPGVCSFRWRMARSNSAFGATSPSVSIRVASNFGTLEKVNAQGLAAGTASDSGDSSKPAALQFWLDQYPCSTCSIGFALADLPGKRFKFQIPSKFKDGRSHKLYVSHKDVVSGAESLLNGSGLTFTVSSVAPVGNLEATSNDAYVGPIVVGWAFDPDRSSDPISVEVYQDAPKELGGQFVSRAQTDVYRDDVNRAHGIAGEHGFVILLPSSEIHTYYVYAIDAESGASNLLESAPRTLGAEKGGFDPGMNVARAATFFLDDPNFFQTCPDASDGSGLCYRSDGAGNNLGLQSGGGFYTLATDGNSCQINSGEPSTPNSGNSNVPCPFYFDWKFDSSGKPISHLEQDTRGYKSWTTPNTYNGIQVNTPLGPNTYGGLENTIHEGDSAMTPFFDTVQSARFDLRAAFCDGSRASDPDRIVRLTYYFTAVNPHFNNPQGYATTEFSIDIIKSVRHSDPYAAVITDPVNRFVFFEDHSVDWTGSPLLVANQKTADLTVHVDASKFEIISNEAIQNALFQDRTADCSQSTLSASSWIEFEIPIRDIVASLVQQGFVSSERLAGAWYFGGMMSGIEAWGRGKTTVEIRDHKLLLRPRPF